MKPAIALASLLALPLFERIIGDTVTPWEWEGCTPEYIERSRKLQ